MSPPPSPDNAIARVVTDASGRRWVQAANVPEVRKLPDRMLRTRCPEVAYFVEAAGRPVRWVPLDALPALLVARGVPQPDAEARAAQLAAAPLSATGLQRQGFPTVAPAPAAPPAALYVPPPASLEVAAEPVASPAALPCVPPPQDETPSTAPPVEVSAAPAELVAEVVTAEGSPTTGTLVSFEVGGWGTMFQTSTGTWVRDLDLAERAALNDPHSIRRTVAKAIADGALTIPTADRKGGTPLAHVVEETVPLGSGATRTVRTYYLNEEGALFILTRLRTPKAIAVTKAVVMAFAALMRGGFQVAPLPAPALPAPAAALALPPAFPVFDENRFAAVVARSVVSAMAEAMPAMLEGMARVVQTLVPTPALVPATDAAPAPATTAPEATPTAPAEAAPVEAQAPAALEPADSGPAPASQDAPPRPPTMLIPRDWRSLEMLAALLGERRGERVSRTKVARAVTDLRIRERPEVARHSMTPKVDSGGVLYEVPFWRYAPGVLDELDRHLFPMPAPQRQGAPSRSAVRR